MNFASSKTSVLPVIRRFGDEWRDDTIGTVAMLLIVGIVVSMTRAFALTNFFELILWVLFLANASLRSRFCVAMKDFRVQLVMIFWLWIAISAFWGSASLQDRLGDIWSWRKLMLVPMASAIFLTDYRKHVLAFSLVMVCAVYMLFSWLGFLEFVRLDRSPSQLLENHSTQGVLFAAASLICVTLGYNLNSRYLRWLCFALSAGCLLNILIVLTGRSGYLFATVISVSMIYMSMRRYRTTVALIVAIAMTSAFLIFDTPKQRIIEGLNEISHVEDAEELTSLGIRIVMWTNTLKIIEMKPILGAGAGSFPIDYQDLVRGIDSWKGVAIDDPHQQYLHITAEYGLIGFFIFAVMLASWLLSSHEGSSVKFVLLGKVFLLGTFANGFANGHFSSFVEGRFIWIFLAAFLAGSRSPIDYVRLFNLSKKRFGVLFSDRKPTSL